MRKTKVSSVLALALLAGLLALGVASAAPGDPAATLGSTAQLRKAVEPASLLVHERRFQQIANDTEEGSRASGTPGYGASARYVASKLRNAGYGVSVQRFEFPFFREVEPAQLKQVSPTPKDYETATFEYSSSGDVTGRLVPTNDVRSRPARPRAPPTAAASPRTSSPPPRLRLRWPLFSAAPATLS